MTVVDVEANGGGGINVEEVQRTLPVLVPDGGGVQDGAGGLNVRLEIVAVLAVDDVEFLRFLWGGVTKGRAEGLAFRAGCPLVPIEFAVPALGVGAAGLEREEGGRGDGSRRPGSTRRSRFPTIRSVGGGVPPGRSRNGSGNSHCPGETGLGVGSQTAGVVMEGIGVLLVTASSIWVVSP